MSDYVLNCMKGAYQYVKDIIDKAIAQNKKLILWGYSKGGVYIRHLVRDIDARRDFDFIIDDYLYIPYAPETKIYRSSILNYINIEEYILLSSVKNANEIVDCAMKHGFVEGRNFFNVRQVIQSSNIEYIENTVKGVDFSYVTQEDRPDIYRGDNYESKPFDHSCIDFVFSEILKLENEITFFDYGCGKGQILLTAYLNGIRSIKGIDLNEDIYDVAVQNMEILNVPCEIVCGNAMDYTDIDDCNVFFFYNPFGGDVFRKVIKNIEDSIGRRKRKVYIAYGNPFNHEEVIKNGIFKLYKQIPVDLYDPLFNIYSNS